MELVDNPDETITIAIDRRTLPKGHHYQPAGVEIRQLFSVRIKRFFTEYQAESLIDEQGNRDVAAFPDDIPNKAQYDHSVKAHAVYIYMSQFQLLPYERIEQYFLEVAAMPLPNKS